MFLGEHAVVYNRPCLVTAVGQRMKATVELISDDKFSLDAPDVKVTGYTKPMSELGQGDMPKGAQFVELAVKNFTEKYPFKGGLKITTQSEFSSQFGFGSSSASTVCVLKALFELYSSREERSDESRSLDSSRLAAARSNYKLLFDLAYKTVLDIQGKASGFDVCSTLYGGTLYFIGGGSIIEPLLISQIPLVVAYTGKKGDSVILINHVAELKKLYPEKTDRLFDSITQLVEQAKVALCEKDWEKVGKLMDFNQEYLRNLGVSDEKLENLIHAAKTAGAWGAKLSGAGGGDCMIALVSDDKKEAVIKSLIDSGGQIIPVQPSVEGVRVEK